MVRIVAVSTLSAMLLLSAGSWAGEGVPSTLNALRDGGTATVAQVLDDGALSLSDGRTVRLLGIRIPNDDKWRPAAVVALNGLTRNHRVRLRLDARSEDRYGHGLAQVVTDDGTWLEAALVSQGLARVESRRDDHAMTRELLDLEATARGSREGLWGDPRYQVMTAEEIAADPRSRLDRFGIVEGTVVDVVDQSNWTFVNFGADWHRDFTIAIGSGDRKRLRAAGLDPAALKGVHIRVRGWVRNWNGPLIEVDHAEQIERLDGVPERAAGAEPR
jgi:micrococcal nuclease